MNDPRLLLNPYGADTDSLRRIGFFASPADIQLLRSISAVKGFETFVLATYYKSICAVISHNNLTYADSRAFHDFILALPATLLAASERHFKNDSRGVEPVCEQPAPQPNISADASQNSPRGRGNRRHSTRTNRQETKEG